MEQFIEKKMEQFIEKKMEEDLLKVISLMEEMEKCRKKIIDEITASGEDHYQGDKIKVFKVKETVAMILDKDKLMKKISDKEYKECLKEQIRRSYYKIKK